MLRPQRQLIFCHQSFNKIKLNFLCTLFTNFKEMHNYNHILLQENENGDPTNYQIVPSGV